MKKQIIISLVLAVVLLFVSFSFAGWNEAGFKNSPLFKHSLKKSVESMENQAKEVIADGENMDTIGSKCNDPRAPVTYSNCETTEATCQGIPTCQQQTCFSTCSDPTCIWYETCGSTCETTCQSTCESTCQSTCGCPPVVQGTVSHSITGGGYSSYWGSNSSDRIIFNSSYPLVYTSFNYWNGAYYTDVFGQPPCNLTASGRISGTLYYDNKFKPRQYPGYINTINFQCTPSGS